MQNFIMGKIHRTAIVSNKAVLRKGVTIGAHSIVYDNVHIGEKTVIGPNCILGEPKADIYKNKVYKNPPLKIGKNSIIRSGSIIYSGSNIGENFETGHRVTIRENTEIGKNCRIGTLSDIQGFCEIGNFVRLHSNVHIGQKSKIGNFVWIFPYTVLTNDPHPPSELLLGVTIDDYSVIATMSVILPGVKIGKHALIGAHSLVRSDISAGQIAIGNPAKEIGSTEKIISKKTGASVYPWPEHFNRGMPWEKIGYSNWIKKS